MSHTSTHLYNTHTRTNTSCINCDLHTQATTLSGEELDLPSNVCGGFQVDPLQTAIPLADLLKLGGGVFPQYVLLNLRTGQGGSDAGSRHVS